MKFKKFLLPFMAGALALGLAACGDDDKKAKEETSKTETTNEEVAQEPTKEEQAAFEEMQKKLVEQQVDKNEIVAIVNEEELKGEEYNTVLMSIQGQMQQMGQDPTSKEATEQIKEQTLDTLVNQTLILQKAKEADIEVSSSEIDEEYKAYEEQFGGKEAMEEALKSQNMDAKTLKEEIIVESLLFEKYIEKVAPAEKATEKEIEKYYDEIAAQSKEAGQELPPLKEISGEIESVLAQEQQQKLVATHIEELKEAAKIEFKI
ncbi:SurA N-terminal domain-containing protein [Sporosarcina sp. G11-34]|uniref:SurA N-terminal domain-containing protein n=1 Tax=Sporosarcina sp. G11-34 TaxID=2849605 RepID=UPI0022A951D7|nr:SurA N-terminal domain-containing protein [Sporosarcina sp. G11-34]MCZ2260937.1 SurA N-terminal domain-containing protein [Sporosarcina sp. G11-34]